MANKRRGGYYTATLVAYSVHILFSMPHCPEAQYSRCLAPTFTRAHLSDTQFLCHWSQGIPIVVTGVRQQGQWSPHYFIERFHTTYVTAEDCETSKEWCCTVAEFFATFLQSGNCLRIWRLKVSFSSPVGHLSSLLLSLRLATERELQRQTS